MLLGAVGIDALTVTPSRPDIPGYNVLNFTGDSFNKKHLSIYGYERDTTPFLSGLAKDAVVFDQMINPSGWTNENLISIFTSLSIFPLFYWSFVLSLGVSQAENPEGRSRERSLQGPCRGRKAQAVSKPN